MFYESEWKSQAANTLDHILQVCCLIRHPAAYKNKNEMSKIKNLKII